MTDFAHPAFGPYRDLLARLGGKTGLEELNDIARQTNALHPGSGRPLRFSASSPASSAAQYEQAIAATGSVPTRENNLHDFFNALVWLRFPRLKSALNLRHCQMLQAQPHEEKRRGRLRDALTLLDESGMLVASSRPALLELLRAKEWVELFRNRRMQVLRHARFIVVGHGLMEKCLAPFPGMTAKCLLLHTPETGAGAIDLLAATAVRDAQVLELPPLPIQGIHGWDAGQDLAYYGNTAIFRPARGA